MKIRNSSAKYGEIWVFGRFFVAPTWYKNTPTSTLSSGWYVVAVGLLVQDAEIHQHCTGFLPIDIGAGKAVLIFQGNTQRTIVDIEFGVDFG